MQRLRKYQKFAARCLQEARSTTMTWSVGRVMRKNPYAIAPVLGETSSRPWSFFSLIAAPAVHRQISIRICHNALRQPRQIEHAHLAQPF